MTVPRNCSLAAMAVSLLVACAPPPSPSRAAPSDASGPEPSSAGAVKSPVFSTDPCERDEDCAPVPTCHANRCTLRSNVAGAPEDLICTMECRAGTVDCGYNYCGCAASPSGKKLCALLPGSAKQ